MGLERSTPGSVVSHYCPSPPAFYLPLCACLQSQRAQAFRLTNSQLPPQPKWRNCHQARAFLRLTSSADISLVAFGGSLIYLFGGTRKVFFDGRGDLYGSDFLKQY